MVREQEERKSEIDDYFKTMKEEVTFTLTRSEIETIRVALEYLGYTPGLEHLMEAAEKARLKLPEPIIAFEFTAGSVDDPE